MRLGPGPASGWKLLGWHRCRQMHRTGAGWTPGSPPILPSSLPLRTPNLSPPFLPCQDHHELCAAEAGCILPGLHPRGCILLARSAACVAPGAAPLCVAPCAHPTDPALVCACPPQIAVPQCCYCRRQLLWPNVSHAGVLEHHGSHCRSPPRPVHVCSQRALLPRPSPAELGPLEVACPPPTSQTTSCTPVGDSASCGGACRSGRPAPPGTPAASCGSATVPNRPHEPHPV